MSYERRNMNRSEWKRKIEEEEEEEEEKEEEEEEKEEEEEDKKGRRRRRRRRVQHMYTPAVISHLNQLENIMYRCHTYFLESNHLHVEHRVYTFMHTHM